MLDDFTIGLHAEIGEAQVRLSAFSTHHGRAASTAGNAVTKASMVATKRIAFESAYLTKACRQRVQGDPVAIEKVATGPPCASGSSR